MAGRAVEKGPSSKRPEAMDCHYYLEGVLFCLGNPLLDISAEVDEDFLKKYNLKSNDAILAGDEHKSMYDDLVANFEADFVPGGATQNTARIAQWLIGIPKSTTFMGCISKDKYGKILEDKCKEGGVLCRYQYTDKEPTGTCAVLITGNERSLVAYLAAANHFSKTHLDVPENRALMEKAEYYYIASYPLTVSPEAMMEVAVHAAANDKFFSLNLSAPFLCQFFKEPMIKILPYVDLLFGNETEAAAFSEANDLGLTDLKEIALRISRFPKQNGKRGRIVIITQGSECSIVCQEGKITEYPVISIEAHNIVDTNGAGDAFVGGYLAHLVQNGQVEDCIRGANYAANFVIQRSGCGLPERPDYCTTTTGF